MPITQITEEHIGHKVIDAMGNTGVIESVAGGDVLVMLSYGVAVDYDDDEIELFKEEGGPILDVAAAKRLLNIETFDIDEDAYITHYDGWLYSVDRNRNYRDTLHARNNGILFFGGNGRWEKVT